MFETGENHFSEINDPENRPYSFNGAPVLLGVMAASTSVRFDFFTFRVSVSPRLSVDVGLRHWIDRVRFWMKSWKFNVVLSFMS
jgi:hypothetical protein